MPKSDYQSQLNLIHNLSTQAQWVQGYQACKIKWDKYTAELRGLAGSVSCYSPEIGYDDELHNLYILRSSNSQNLATLMHFVLIDAVKSISQSVTYGVSSQMYSFPSCNQHWCTQECTNIVGEREEKGSERKTKLKSSSEQPAGSRLPTPIQHCILSSLSACANTGTKPE